MHEYASPSLGAVTDDDALGDAVVDNAAAAPDQVLFRRKVDGRWQPVTGKEFATQVASAAAGLVASGVQPGDRIAVLSRTRYEWTLMDYAIWTAGAVCVPVYETSSAEQIQWILADSGAVGAVVETAAHQQTVDSLRGLVPSLRSVWQIEAGGIDALAEAGRDVPHDDLEARRTGTRADDLATVIYTSGTTGRPKGCEITHRNLLNVAHLAPTLIPAMHDPEASTLLFLPLAHVFARIIEVACVTNRVELGHTADLTELLADLGEFRPTFLLGVPRIFEKVHSASRQKAHSSGKGGIFDRAEATAIAWSQAVDAGGAGLGLRLQHAVFDKLVYSKLRAALGGRVTVALSGGAPLGARLGHFFRGIGVNVLEGYGLTETTGPTTCNSPSAQRIGTVGRPVPGTTVRIGDGGEILVAGEPLLRGYWHNPEATAQAVDADGWFRTGDIGELDEDGYLTITGRIKELIVTAGGKNVSPFLLEYGVLSHPLVGQAMVVGDSRPYISCLVTLNPEAVGPWLESHGRPADTPLVKLASDPDVLAEIQSAVDTANRSVSRAESIRRFAVLPQEWTQEAGHLTPSLKLKRDVVLAEFAEHVERLYAPES